MKRAEADTTPHPALTRHLFPTLSLARHLSPAGESLSPRGKASEEEAKLAQRMDYHCDELEQNTGAALMTMDQMPPDMQDAAVKQICDRLADCKEMVFAWACAHGEP